VLHHPNRAWAATCDRRDVIRVQIGKDPQRDDLGLVRRERRDERKGFTGRNGLERLAFQVLRALELDKGGGRHQICRSTVTPSSPIGQASAGDGEKPPPKRRLISSKAFQCCGDVQPHLGGKVFRLSRFLCPQVAQQGRVKIAVERHKGPFGSRPCGGENSLELSTESDGRKLRPCD
jgi:hypothetical protein